MDRFTVKRDKTFRKTAARNKIALDLILSRTDVISARRADQKSRRAYAKHRAIANANFKMFKWDLLRQLEIYPLFFFFFLIKMN